MGGEKILEPSMGVGNFGSPPRWRGKAVKFRCTCGLQRITPAQAGKSRKSSGATSSSRDHPRVGGEKALRTLNRWAAWGSPPHGRGKVLFRLGVHVIVGITPAQAGKRAIRSAAGSGSGDHPRTGGEKYPGSTDPKDRWGSPPRGRGKVGAALRKERLSRITPA